MHPLGDGLFAGLHDGAAVWFTISSNAKRVIYYYDRFTQSIVWNYWEGRRNLLTNLNDYGIAFLLFSILQPYAFLLLLLLLLAIYSYHHYTR